MVLSGSFGGVGASVLTPGIEDARARSSNMLMKSISGSNGILDKAMPLGRNRTDGTRDSLSRDQIGTAGRDDQVASLEADCRGACTKLKPCRDAAPGYTSALCARDACARDLCLASLHHPCRRRVAPRRLPRGDRDAPAAAAGQAQGAGAEARPPRAAGAAIAATALASALPATTLPAALSVTTPAATALASALAAPTVATTVPHHHRPHDHRPPPPPSPPPGGEADGRCGHA